MDNKRIIVGVYVDDIVTTRDRCDEIRELLRQYMKEGGLSNGNACKTKEKWKCIHEPASVYLAKAQPIC